ncbi:MAG: sulfocyanin-like copper-binding protein [Gemmatimonadota bacterium]|nr:sulfocyanin-like copper-binding protein [Gemmatimonadota bacterium]MDE2678337.1 sulfocyanin-like copper-binding protein [Gemmatimonadota bacterium]
MARQSIILTVGVVTLLGCGGGEVDDSPASAPGADMQTDAAASAPTPADWISVDAAARTATVTLVAAETDANNRWNFNGHANGEATVVVPVGYTVTINFENRDPVHYHSAGVLAKAASYPPIFDEATPVFDGAITSNATSMSEATEPGGGTGSFTFVASEAGEYSLVSLVPANAVTGMWIGLEVSASGDSGLRD